MAAEMPAGRPATVHRPLHRLPASIKGAPTCLVVLALCKMLLLAHYSEPELETVWVVLWCVTVAVLLLIIVCIECPPPRRFVQ